jgi:hypothetical protein
MSNKHRKHKAQFKANVALAPIKNKEATAGLAKWFDA